MSAKRGETYSSVVSFLRRRFRFDLLKTCIIALRGYKKPSSTPAKIETLDRHGFEGNCYILLRITDVMYRCLKEDLIYFENCVDFTFLRFIVAFRVSIVAFRVSIVVFRVSFVAFYRVSFVATPCFNRGQAVVKGLITAVI